MITIVLDTVPPLPCSDPLAAVLTDFAGSRSRRLESWSKALFSARLRSDRARHRERELDELREWFGEMGLEEEDTERVVAALDTDDEALMRVMMALEFGVVESERRNPYLAMLSSGALFLVGALPSIVPFLFLDDTGVALAWAFALAGTGLFVVGAVKTLATRGNWFLKGAENLAIAAVGGAVAYWVGSAFESWLA